MVSQPTTAVLPIALVRLLLIILYLFKPRPKQAHSFSHPDDDFFFYFPKFKIDYRWLVLKMRLRGGTSIVRRSLRLRICIQTHTHIIKCKPFKWIPDVNSLSREGAGLVNKLFIYAERLY